eukprot:2682735-Amphidinium_carterae.1
MAWRDGCQRLTVTDAPILTLFTIRAFRHVPREKHLGEMRPVRSPLCICSAIQAKLSCCFQSFGHYPARDLPMPGS